MSSWHKFAIAFLVLATTALANNEEPDHRRGKLFPVFQVVTFPNDPCPSTSSRNGTCYTERECKNKGGTASGSCANSFGVCCVFTATCGATSNENCTYFTPPSTTVSSGTCRLRICPCGTNICQLRLDFNRFVISGPSTLTSSIGQALFNNLVNANGRAVTNNGQCLTDTFSVSTNAGGSPPTICGTNTGQHMYVDATQDCNDLTFGFGSQALGTTLATRDWEIKITQYSCDHPNRAPPGCTEYFYGSNTGTVQTYNFQNEHLANQDQVFCVRREQGFCRICWSATANRDFMVSNQVAAIGAKVVGGGVNLPSECGGYGPAGIGIAGYDFVEIPGAVKAAAAIAVPSRICGRSFGLVTVNGGTTGTTICSTQQPFLIRFVSDTFENVPESASPDGGFRLGYFMDSTNC